jgi:phosphate-selective porin OprO/OprP
MKRIAGGLVLGASLLALAPAATAGDAAGGQTEAERQLLQVQAELEAQRLQIAELKARLNAPAAPEEGGVEAAVKKYLESEEGRKLLGKGSTDLRAFWKEGLNFETADKQFSLKVNGRLMFDMLMPDPDDDLEAAVGDIDAMSGFRRVRVEMGGTIHKDFYYQNNIGFEGTPHTFKDNFIGYKGLPAGTHVQVGFMKEPVGLEELTSSKYITFMERSMATNAFAPAFDVGVMVFGSLMEDKVNWAIGDFADNSNGPGSVNWQHNFSARLCGTPIVNKEKNLLVHVGGSIQDRSPESETRQFRARPDVGFGPRVQDTGAISADTVQIIGLEGAAVYGPWSVQGEIYQADVEDHPDAPGGSPTYKGWYLFGSYFVTGESRPYKGGTFGRVKPKSNFDGKKGWGAVEVAVRYCALDLDDDGVDGGTGSCLTPGVNWYLNPNTRVMLNYAMYERRHLDDGVNTLSVRFQIDF